MLSTTKLQAKRKADAKMKEDQELEFLAETKDMKDNEVIKLRKKRAKEAVEASYLTMNSVELAVSKYVNELPDTATMALKRVLLNEKSIDDQEKQSALISSASHCVLLQHIDKYLSCNSFDSMPEFSQGSMRDNFNESVTSEITYENISRGDKKLEANQSVERIAHDNLQNFERPSNNSNDGNGCEENYDDCGEESCHISRISCPDENPEVDLSEVINNFADENDTVDSSIKNGMESFQGGRSQQEQLISNEDVANRSSTIYEVAEVAVNDTLNASIEKVIKSLRSYSPRSSLISSNNESIDNTENNRIHLQSPDQSVRSNISAQDEFLEEVKIRARDLAGVITSNILCSALYLASRSESALDCTGGRFDVIASNMARVLTPTLIAEAIDSACNNQLRHSSSDRENEIRAVAETVAESVTPDVVVGSLLPSLRISSLGETKCCDVSEFSPQMSPEVSAPHISGKAEEDETFLAFQYQRSDDLQQADGYDKVLRESEEANMSSFEAKQHSHNILLEEDGKIPSLNMLSQEWLYKDIFNPTSRGLRKYNSDGQKHVKGNIILRLSVCAKCLYLFFHC